ncbi:MAG: Hsp20/alpha crystallin family protein [Anaerolineae bacterium]|nr:MAG: Hsp20/alpha crystallin family protein [Anaerolineae bacterium]
MTNLTRWEPFSDLLSVRKQMDDIFESFFARPISNGDAWSMPLVDLYQTDDDVMVKATLPGVEAKDLDIQITGDALTIRAEVQHEEEKKDKRYHLREQRYTAFARTLPLPVPVVADKAEAEMKNGVLTLRLPKAEEVKPKSITVKAK